MVVDNSSRPNYKPLHELVAIFVHNKLHLGQENKQRSARAVGGKLLQYSHEYGSKISTAQQLQKLTKHFREAAIHVFSFLKVST